MIMTFYDFILKYVLFALNDFDVFVKVKLGVEGVLQVHLVYWLFMKAVWVLIGFTAKIY